MRVKTAAQTLSQTVANNLLKMAEVLTTLNGEKILIEKLKNTAQSINQSDVFWDLINGTPKHPKHDKPSRQNPTRQSDHIA